MWSFVPDPQQGGAEVSLRALSVSQDQATLLVQAKGIETLRGIAFRLVFDPNRIQVASVAEADAWKGAGTLVKAFAVRADGEAWGGLGFRGTGGSISAGDATVLAQLQLKLPPGGQPIPIGFRKHRNLVMGGESKQLDVLWLGGQFVVK
jgi:hypothetical protein